MDTEEDSEEGYKQLLFYIAPMALSVAFCLCCVRIIISNCVKAGRRLRSPRTVAVHPSVSFVEAGLPVRQSIPNTGLMNRVGVESLRQYLRCSYGDIFLQAPPPTYDDSQKQSAVVIESSGAMLNEEMSAPPDNGVIQPPPSYPPSRQISQCPNAGMEVLNSGVLTLHIEDLMMASGQSPSPSPIRESIGMHTTKPAGHGSAAAVDANRKNNVPESGEKRSGNVKVRLHIGNTSERLSQATPEGLTHKWTVFVRPSRQSPIRRFTDRSFIRKVVFQLHETFKNRVRTVREPPFEVVERGYGAFTVAISIFFRGLTAPVEVDHELVLSTTDRYKEFSEERRLELKNADEDLRKLAEKYAPPHVTKPSSVSGEHSGVGSKGSGVHSPKDQKSEGKEKKKVDIVTATSPSRGKKRSPEREKDRKFKHAGKAPRKEETGGMKTKQDRKEKAPKQPASRVISGQVQGVSSEPVLPKTSEAQKQQNPSSSADLPESSGGAQLEDSSSQDASRVHNNNSKQKRQEAGGDRKSKDPARKPGDDCKPQPKVSKNEAGRILRLKAQLESLRDSDLLYLVADALIELEPNKVSMTIDLGAIDFDMEHMSENSLRRIEDILNRRKGAVPEGGAPRVDDEDGKASQSSNVNGSEENSISPLSSTTHISTSLFCNDDLYEL